MFKEIKQYLHFGSYRFCTFEAYMNHILMVAFVYCLLKSLYPKRSIAESKRFLTQSSQTMFLHELKYDFNKFNGNKIVKNKILEAISAVSGSIPLSIADWRRFM